MSFNNMEKEQIYAYRKKINGNGYVKVNYKHKKGVLNVGRYFAEGALSLQSFKKQIRHTLARDYYVDVDMVNAHPTILMQYCKRHSISCPI